MFHGLRRLILGMYMAAWVCLVAYLVDNPKYVAPFAEGYGQLRNRILIWAHWWEDKDKISGQQTGEVTKVMDGNTFQVMDATGQRYNFRLAGTKVPQIQYHLPPRLRGAGERSRQYLRDLILSNEVQIGITTLTPQRSGLGVVTVGETNVNVAVVRYGFAMADSQSVESLPTATRLELEEAQERAQTQRLGIWARWERVFSGAVQE